MDMQPQDKQAVQPWLIARDAGFTSRFKHGPLSKQGVLQAAFCLCNVITMVDTLFCSYVLDFLVYTAGVPGSIAGGILMASELFNVIVGVFASILMDHFPFAAFGKHRFWTLVTILPLFLTFTMLWWPIDATGPDRQENVFAKTVFYAAALLLFNFFYGTLIVAYEGSIPLLASSSTALTRINVIRLCVGSCSSVLAILFAASTDFLMQDSSFRYLVQAAISGGVVALLFLVWVYIAEERFVPPPALMRQGSIVDQLPIFSDFRPSARRVLRRAAMGGHQVYNIDQYRYHVDLIYGDQGPELADIPRLDLPASLPEEEFWGSVSLGATAEQQQVEEEYSHSAPEPSAPIMEDWESSGSESGKGNGELRFQETPNNSMLSQFAGATPGTSFPTESEPLRIVGFNKSPAGSVPNTGFYAQGVLSGTQSLGSKPGLLTSALSGSKLDRQGGLVELEQEPQPMNSAETAYVKMTADETTVLRPRKQGPDSVQHVSLDAPIQGPVDSPAAKDAPSSPLDAPPNATWNSKAGASGLPPTGGQRMPLSRSPSKHERRQGLKLWAHYSSQLLSGKPFRVLIFNHFLLWGILTFTQAALPAFVHTYLDYDAVSEGASISGSVLIILVLQCGHAVAQTAMGIWPEQLHPVLILRASLLAMVLAKLAFFFAFAWGLAPSWVFLVAGIDGLAEGGMFASYEIMVPEVVWDDERKSGMRRENLVYGWVDSTRELSLALSFFGVGLVLGNVSSGLAERICVGLVPIPLIIICGCLQVYYPHILIPNAGPAFKAPQRQARSDAQGQEDYLQQPLLHTG